MRYILLLALLIPSVAAMQITLDIAESGIVRETIQAPQIQEDVFAFSVATQPIGIIYEGEYSLHEREGGYEIEFVNNRRIPLEFTLIFEDLILQSGTDRAFHADFVSSDNLTIDLHLPQGNTLAGSMSPHATVTTDGQRIMLHWELENDAAIAVFYRAPKNNLWIAFILIPLFAFAGALTFLFLRRRMRVIVEDTLSEDEQKVVSQLRNKITLQKVVAKNLDFSKSKISKVIRKLEEKGLIAKEPHFKTNKLRLLRIA